MDDAEIARLRKDEPAGPMNNLDRMAWLRASRRALLDALEQAQKEITLRAEAVRLLIAQRDAAQQDAKDAHALLGECAKVMDGAVEPDDAALLARIEAMLEKKL